MIHMILMLSHVVACEFRKYENDRIEISEVEAFVTFLEDVGANKGVMVSPCGFQSGAISVAKCKNIDLFVFKEVDENEVLHYFKNIKEKVKKGKTYGVLISNDKPIICIEMSLTHISCDS